MSGKLNYADFTDEQYDALDAAVSNTLNTMLGAETKLSSMLNTIRTDSEWRASAASILKLRSEIDLLNNEYQAFDRKEVGFQPPSADMVNQSKAISEKFAALATKQQKADAWITIGEQAIVVATGLLGDTAA